MKRFEIGDTVKVTSSKGISNPNIKKDMVGRVVNLNLQGLNGLNVCDIEDHLGIEFEEHIDGHGCDETSAEENAWWLRAENVEKVGQNKGFIKGVDIEIEVGDIVEIKSNLQIGGKPFVTEDMLEFAGDVCEVIEVADVGGYSSYVLDLYDGSMWNWGVENLTLVESDIDTNDIDDLSFMQYIEDDLCGLCDCDCGDEIAEELEFTGLEVMEMIKYGHLTGDDEYTRIRDGMKFTVDGNFTPTLDSCMEDNFTVEFSDETLEMITFTEAIATGCAMKLPDWEDYSIGLSNILSDLSIGYTEYELTMIMTQEVWIVDSDSPFTL